jgi:hypothetical protein
MAGENLASRKCGHRRAAMVGPEIEAKVNNKFLLTNDKSKAINIGAKNDTVPARGIRS